jgi:hypothetical protein
MAGVRNKLVSSLLKVTNSSLDKHTISDKHYLTTESVNYESVVFYSKGPGANPIKIFTGVIYEFTEQAREVNTLAKHSNQTL